MAQEVPWIELVLCTAVSAVAWAAKTLYSKVGVLEEKVSGHQGRFNNVVTVAEKKEAEVKGWVEQNFVRKDAFQDAISHLEEVLDKRFDRFEQKLDKVAPPTVRAGSDVGKTWGS